jgi:ABC-2 type transport system ATP-binding protein
VLEESPLVERVETRDGRLAVTLREGVGDYSDLPAELIRAGHKLVLFREEEISLEAAFMALTKGSGAK